MNIIVKDKEAGERFLTGKSVFQIVTIHAETPIDKSLVTTKEDYEKKLDSHEYISILHVAPLHYKLAYIYGCLNRVRGTPRDEKFLFYTREIGKREWALWFEVLSYKD